MDIRQARLVFLVIFLFFSNQIFSATPLHLFLALSGGYGRAQDSYQSTGTNGLIRFGCGSTFQVDPMFAIGQEIGFQTSNQVRLNSQITPDMGTNSVPVFVNSKTPIDFLALGRVVFYHPIFLQVKGGMAFVGSTATGADIQTENAWVPEVQIGVGINISNRSRIILSYQEFFGTTPIVSVLDATNGTYLLKGSPTWQGELLTFQHDL